MQQDARVLVEPTQLEGFRQQLDRLKQYIEQQKHK